MEIFKENYKRDYNDDKPDSYKMLYQTVKHTILRKPLFSNVKFKYTIIYCH